MLSGRRQARDTLRRFWPLPSWRWPVAVVMVLATSLVGCVATKLSGVPAGVVAHLVAILSVMTVLAIRSTLRVKRQQRSSREGT